MVDISLLYVTTDTPDTALQTQLTEQIRTVIVHHKRDPFFSLINETWLDVVFFEYSSKTVEYIEQTKIAKPFMPIVVAAPSLENEQLLQLIRIGITDVVITPASDEEISGLVKKLHYAALSRSQRYQKNILFDQYKQAMDASLIISRTDKNGIIHYVNDRFVQLSGYRADEILGHSHSLFKHPKTSKEQMSELWQTVSGKKVWHGVIINQNKTGHPFYTDTFIIPLLNEKNEIDEYMDIRIDVTPLYVQSEYFQQVVDTQPAMIAVIHQTEIIRVNRSFLDFFGYADLDTFRHAHPSIIDLIPDNSDYTDHTAFNAWMESIAEVRGIKIDLRDSQGETKVFKAHKSSFINNKNEEETILSLNDITDIEHYARQLQETIDDVTARLEDQHQKLLQHTRSAALGEMFDNIAHQWRQPISAISNEVINLQFATELGSIEPEELNSSFHRIEEYCLFLSNTIDDFRNFSNPSKAATRFRVCDSIDKTLDIVMKTFESYHIEIRFSCAQAAREVKTYGPIGELTQVLLNLLNNAKDALIEKEEDIPIIEIEAIQAGHFFRIRIDDNAGGIPTEIIDKIFDPYFTTKHKAQGTGIGLYMSRTIIEHHFQGSLDVHNTEQGARFTILLPIEEKSE
jgi:PAS domain S-box-containing protein